MTGRPTSAAQEAKLLLTIPEAAELLGIGKTLAWSLVQQGELPSVRLGRLVRIPRVELEAWVVGQAKGKAALDVPALRRVS